MQYSCPSRFPEGAVDIIAQLLRKEPESRLGNMRNGVSDIMAHAWFHGLNWDDVLEARLEAPYVPPKPNASTGSHPKARMVDLNDVIKNPDDYGYWPGWN